jgi:magnesium-transporting ATPase (P-type)
MSMIIRGAEPGMFRQYTKGAITKLLPVCTKIQRADGSVVELTEDEKQRIEGETVHNYAE